MDELDLEILQRIGAAPFLVWPHPPAGTTTAGLARALGVSKETIRRRLSALASSGVLMGRSVAPNYRALGWNCCTVHFRTEDAQRKATALAEVAALDGVLAVFDMLGPDVCVDICFEDEADRRRKVAAMQERIGPCSVSLFLDVPLPAVEKAPSALDWRIIEALLADATRQPEDVAKDLHVSARTVKRRVAAMHASGAIDVVGNVDPSRFVGHFLAYLLVRLHPGSGRADATRVVHAFRRRWVAQWSPPDRDLADVVIVALVTSSGAADDLRKEAMSMAEVARAEVLILSRVESRPAWLASAIAQRATMGDGQVVRPAAPIARAPSERSMSKSPRRVRRAPISNRRA